MDARARARARAQGADGGIGSTYNVMYVTFTFTCTLLCLLKRGYSMYVCIHAHTRVAGLAQAWLLQG